MVSKTSFLCEKRVVRPGKELQPESSTAAGSSQPRREVGRSKPQDPAIECLRLAARKSPTSTQNTGAGDPCFVQSSRNSKHPRPLRLLHQFSRLLSSSWSLTGPGRNMGRTSPKISREQEEEIKKRKNKNKKQKQARAAGHRSSFALSPTQHKLAFAGPARGSGRQEPRDVPSLSGVWSPAEVSREHLPWMFASSVDALAEKNWRLSFGTCRLGCFGRHQSCVLRYSDLNFFFLSNRFCRPGSCRGPYPCDDPLPQLSGISCDIPRKNAPVQTLQAGQASRGNEQKAWDKFPTKC